MTVATPIGSFDWPPWECYQAYEAARDEAAAALRAWWTAPSRDRGQAFAAYRAAADREDAAAEAWLASCALASGNGAMPPKSIAPMSPSGY